MDWWENVNRKTPYLMGTPMFPGFDFPNKTHRERIDRIDARISTNDFIPGNGINGKFNISIP